MVAARAAAWLLLAAAACAPREQDFYDFKAVNIRGKLVSLEKYRGSVSVRPPGLGAAPPDPGRGAERPGPCRVGLRGARGVRSPSPGSPPPPRHPPPRAWRPQILGRVCPMTTWHGPACAVKPETLAARADFPPSAFGQRGAACHAPV